MIILYKGARGCGKTMTMVKDGLKFLENGYKILRNFECNYGKYIDNQEILELSKESNITNCVLMIDEIQIFFDNRRSMLKQNITFSNFIQQIRKRGIIILCTTQYSNTIDMRLRQHLDIIAYPHFQKEYNVCEVLYLDLTSLQDDILNPEMKPKECKMVYDCEPIYKLYNTGEMIV